ncbi:MAG: class I SAM-dependent methyltransferase [Pyrinomonadaceae bacterium]
MKLGSLMMEVTEIGNGGDAATLYDRIAGLYNLTFKVNGYGRSLERYFESSLPLLPVGARILDAGCGTGLLTKALTRALPRPAKITAMDLSASSLRTARDGVKSSAHEICFAQANLLALPFADNSFDLVVTSGALEYVSLPLGFAELARVIAPRGHLVHIPVRPSIRKQSPRSCFSASRRTTLQRSLPPRTSSLPNPRGTPICPT